MKRVSPACAARRRTRDRGQHLARGALFAAIALALFAVPLRRVAAQDVPSGVAPGPAAASSSSPNTAAGISILPALWMGMAEDSNVFGTRDVPASDLYYMFAPSLVVRANGNGKSLVVDAAATATRYRHLGSEDTNDYRVDADGSINVGAHGSVFGGVGYYRAHEDRESPDAALGTTPTVYSDAHAHLGIAQRWGRWGIRTGLTYDRLDFRDVPDASGGLINNADRNRDVLGIGLRTSYAITNGTSVFAQGTLDRRTYAWAVDDAGYRRSSDGGGWVVGVSLAGNAITSAEFYAGWLRQDYRDPRLPTVSVPDIGARLKLRATDQLTVEGAIDRSIEETTLPGSSAYVNTNAELLATQAINARWSAHAGIAWNRSAFQGIARVDQIYDANVGFDYRLTRALTLMADYHLVERRSDVQSAEFVRNLFSVALRVSGNSAALPASASATTASTAATGDWSGVYLGAGAGYGVVATKVVAPRGSEGYLDTSFAKAGSIGSAYLGYGWQLGRAYAGVELAWASPDASWEHAKTPQSRVFGTGEGAGEALNLRVGYVLKSNSLFYVSAGAARTRYTSNYAPESGTLYAQSDTVRGRDYGVGLDVPASRHWFLRAAYQRTRDNADPVAYGTGTDVFRSHASRFLMGVGWRAAPFVQVAPSGRPDGFYAGAQVADAQLGSRFNAVQRQAGPPAVANFTADFGDSGSSHGLFAGWGWSLGPLYVGAEAEGDAGSGGWSHAKLPEGRDFSVSSRNTYVLSLRLGFRTANGSIAYLRAGRAHGQFTTVYEKGQNPNAWVDRDDTLTGTQLGAGLETPLTAHAFVRLEYTYTHYPSLAFTTTQQQADQVAFSNWQSLFRIGLGLRF